MKAGNWKIAHTARTAHKAGARFIKDTDFSDMFKARIFIARNQNERLVSV